tara:strand:- start:2202 stop:2552 length:351 start_codon:yes stop_codon:yes gene_type:complete
MDNLQPKDFKIKHPEFGHVIFYGVTQRQIEVLNKLEDANRDTNISGHKLHEHLERNIKVQIIDPTGVVIQNVDTNYPVDQLDRFLSQNRIAVVGDKESVYFISDEHRWNPLDKSGK